MENFQKLNRSEMKNVSGGVAMTYVSGCTCTGSVGSWTYTNPVPLSQASTDVTTYCRSGSGTCTYSSGSGY